MRSGLKQKAVVAKSVVKLSVIIFHRPAASAWKKAMTTALFVARQIDSYSIENHDCCRCLPGRTVGLC